MSGQPPYNPNNGQGMNQQQQRQPSAWQPNPPTGAGQAQQPNNSTLQQAAGQQQFVPGQGMVPTPQQVQQPPHGYHHPVYAGQAAAQGGYGGHPQYGHPPPQMAPPHPGMRPPQPGMWQQQAPAPPGPGVYYPPPPQQQQQQPKQPPQAMQQPAAAAAPAARRTLVITDKFGNPVDFGAPKKDHDKPASSLQAAASAPTPSSDAGSKMRQAALERIQGAEKAKKEAEEKVKREAEEKIRKEAEEKARKEAEEKAKKEAEEKAKKEAEEKAKREAEEKVRKEAEEKAKKEAAAAAAARPPALGSLADRLKAPAPPGLRPGGAGLRPGGAGLRPGGAAASPSVGLRPGGGVKPMAIAPKVGSGKRHVYTKQELLAFREMDICLCRPESLPDMTIQRGPSTGGGGGGGGGDRGGGDRGGRRGGGQQNRGHGGGGDSWSRGTSAPNRSRPVPQAGGQQWSRGHAPPPPKPNQNKGGNRGGRGGRNDPPPLYDGPVAPLAKSENRWMPKKNVSAMAETEKKMKSILNKMTKEKFARLANQICEIPILSYEMLSLVISQVYEKAINEPSFGDMYADLCAELSKTAQGTSFVHIIESDEEPSVDADGGQSNFKVYRWSNDVSLTDSEVIGPFGTAEECIQISLDPDKAPDPIERGEMELELDSLKIQNGVFIKVMKTKDAEEGEEAFYTVFFPVSEAKECGQQLSSEIFLSERECISDANKRNSFKSSLLNKCEDEFNKQDIYVEWKKEKKEYDEKKSTLTESEREAQMGELNFRRMKIKKQMLGNVKFIGQLYKKGLLKEKIMRYCIASLLKLDDLKQKSKYPEYKDSGDFDLDEEDHEAVCSMFTTIGSTIDHHHASSFMKVCFDKVAKMSDDQRFPARSRFMYKDLIELRQNNWKLRRAIETAKTIDEIRKDVEREERLQAQQSQQMGGYRGGRGGDHRGGRGGDRRDDHRDRGRNDSYRGNDNRRGQSNQYDNRRGSRGPQKATPQQDDDGFTQIVGRGPQNQSSRGRPAPKQQQPAKRKPSPVKKREPSPPPKPAASTSEPLSRDKLERRVDNIRSEFMQDRKNIDELLLSVDELSGTPEAGLTLVQKNADRIIDCKDEEREAIIEMITILYGKDKLKKKDVEAGMAEMVEFIESFVIDAPRAFEFLGQMLGSLFNAKALSASWLAEQCKKLEGADGPEKVVKCTCEAIKAKYGADAVKASFGGSSDSTALTGLLGDEKWNAIFASTTA